MPELFPYQVAGASFLAGRKRAALFDEPGLGKSGQAVAACDEVCSYGALIICPASIVENWKREIAKFSRAPWPYEVLSYDAARERKDKIAAQVVVLDESHFLKTPEAARTRVILGPECDGLGGIIENAEHVYFLTGTPMPNNPAELWPMIRVLCPEEFIAVNGKPMTYEFFMERYCRLVSNGHGGITVRGGKNLDELKRKLEGKFLRRKKADVLKDLPPLTVDVLALEGKIKLPATVTEEFQMVEQTLAERGIEGLKEIAPHVATLRRLTGMAKVAPVVEWVKDQLEGGLDKIVLFAQHRDVIDGLTAGLDDFMKSREQWGAVVKGDTPAGFRQVMVDGFQEDKECPVFIGQIQAAGTGLTLTAASQLLFVESSWVPAENEQAAMRIHRIGQKNACLVRFATLAGSIDEQIAKACARKMEDIKVLFG